MGAPGGSLGGGAGAFGGRAGSALAPPILTLSLPPPPGPRLLFCPGASPTHRPRRLPAGPPSPSLPFPARRSAAPAAAAAPLPYCSAGSL